MTMDDKNSNPKICLLGASFETGNLGVGALAESSIKVILKRWPDAEIVFFGSGFTPRQNRLNIAGREICVQTLPVRFSKNVFLPYHFLWFVLYGLLSKILPGSRAKEKLFSHNPYVRTLYETDLGVDITGGDSFSDIYGFKRFFIGTLRKWLFVLFGKRLVMMPQTYGPFKRRLTKSMARYILNRASLVYSRDRAGVGDVNKLLNNSENGSVRFVPDVAFVLDSREPQNTEISILRRLRAEDVIVVGLNISGLLYNSGHTRNERFGLKTDYRQLVYQVARLLLENDKVKLLLIPHVLRPDYAAVDDVAACLELYKQLGQEYPGRKFVVRGEYDQGEIKHVISLCDFFVGSRMHSCIAAMSQCIPAIGLAYSKKFRGVFESVGAEELVIDMHRHSQDEILTAISSAFGRREAIAERLRRTIPDVQAKILNMFRDFEL